MLADTLRRKCMNQELIDHMLYECEDRQELLSAVENIPDEETLFHYARLYNWDDGFEVPYAVAEHEYCTLGTAMMLFFDADGELLLLNETDELEPEHLKFISFLHDRILNGYYRKSLPYFDHKLSNTCVYRLKKAGAAPVFYDNTLWYNQKG